MKRTAVILIFLISFQFLSSAKSNAPDIDWVLTMLFGGRSQVEAGEKCILSSGLILNLTDNGIYYKTSSNKSEWKKVEDNTNSVLGDVYLDIACKNDKAFVVGNKGVGLIDMSLMTFPFIEPVAAPAVGPFTPPLNSIAIHGDSIIVSVAGSDITFYSLDCGETWSEHSPQIPGAYRVVFADSAIKWIAAPLADIPSQFGISTSISVSGEFKPANEGLPSGGSAVRDFALSANYAYTIDDPSGEVYRSLMYDTLNNEPVDSMRWERLLTDYLDNIEGLSADANSEKDRIYTWNSKLIRRIVDHNDNSGITSTNLNHVGKVEINEITELNGVVFASTNDGPYRADLNEIKSASVPNDTSVFVNWVRDVEGVAAVDVKSLIRDSASGNLYAGTSGGRIERSADEGLNWESVGNLPDEIVQLSISANGNVLALTLDSGLYRSSASLEIWEKIGLDLPFPNELSEIVVDPMGNLFGSIYLHGIFTSPDNGDTWNLLRYGSPGFMGMGQDKNLYVFINDSLVRTGDAGENWEFVANYKGECFLNPHSLAVLSGGEVFLGTQEFFSINPVGLYKVSGDTLAQVEAEGEPDFTGIPFPYLAVADKDVLFAVSGQFASPTSRIYMSADKGETWERYADEESFGGRPLQGIVAYNGPEDSLRVFISPARASVVRNWTFPGSSTEIQSVIQNKNLSWMEKPYPNPANSTVNIVLNLPEAESINLEVYDMQGRRVETIYSGRINSGRQELSWDSRGLSSGVYVIQMKAGTHIESRRISILPK